jgi:hypothetical protein
MMLRLQLAQEMDATESASIAPLTGDAVLADHMGAQQVAPGGATCGNDRTIFS